MFFNMALFSGVTSVLKGLLHKVATNQSMLKTL